MTLNNNLNEKVMFAHFCITYNVKPYELAKLIAFANRAYSVGVRRANGKATEKQEHVAADDFETQAKSMNFGVMWPGFWPILTRDGQEVNCPI